MMTAVRYTCGKIGLVSGTGVAGSTTRAIPATAGYTAVFALLTANSIKSWR